MPVVDTNKLIGALGAAILVLGGMVWQNLNSSITDLASELKETTRTMGQMKEDLAVVRTKLEYVAPVPRSVDWLTSGDRGGAVGTSSETARPIEKN